MHLYCGQLAEALNDAGLDMKRILDDEVDIPWTKQSVKDHLWRPIQEVMTGKSSTTEPNTVEFSDVYKVLDRHISVKHGVSVAWPDRFGGQ